MRKGQDFFFSTARAALLALATSAIAMGAQSAEQKITGSPANVDVKAGETGITVELIYSVTDNQQTTGASAKIFYDSKALVFKSLARADDLPKPIAITDVPGSESLDTSDLDGDDKTDSFANIAYSDFGGEFPDAELLSDGSTLFATVVFDLAETAEEDTVTTINFKGDTAAGFDFVSESTTITIKGDEIKPTITLAESSVTIEAQGPLTDEDNSQELTDYIATITVDDNIDDLTTDDIEESSRSKDGEEVSTEGGFAPGTYEVTLVVKDSSRNESDPVVVTLTVVDTIAPLLSGVSDVTLAALNAEGIASAGQLAISAEDLVDGPIEVVLTVGGEELPSAYPLGSPTVVTVTATDKSGNTSTETLTVTVTDQTKPVIVSAAGVEFRSDR